MIRLVLAISLDGRLAPPEGGAAQLGGAGDRAVLEEALAWADGALIGATTLRLHGSTCLIRRPKLLAQRRQDGRDDQPVALVVSRGGGFDPGLAFFRQPPRRWLLAPEGTSAFGFERSLPLAPWPGLLERLAGLGLHRLVLLGGAQLAASLLAEDLVDELQLTLCPRLLGGTHGWLPPSVALSSADWELQEHRPLGQGELLLRYRRLPLSSAADDPLAAFPRPGAAGSGAAGSGAADP
ncbi:MAG: dihydrofolate reductase family protein [Synechococcaceae cyanobacterium ELA445]